MAEQLVLSDLRFPPGVSAAVRSAVEGLGVTLRAENAEKTQAKQTKALPLSPFVVFINGKSGGRLGPDLLWICTELLSPEQVYDLQTAKPHKVLPAVLSCLDEMIAQSGDESARAVRKNLKVFVAGGDGTVGWLLSVVESVATDRPPIAVIPLGTGNDLSRSYGWGPTFSVATNERIERRLLEGAHGQLCPLDSWLLKVIPSPDLDVASLTEHVPPALHAGQTTGEDGPISFFSGNFFNYFSLGMDAQVAYAFHHLRETKPEIARGPRVNKALYGTFGCTQGWFCASCAPEGNAKCLHMVANVQIQKEEGGPFVDLPLDQNLRALIILNLQSYAGGMDPWGYPGEAVETEHGWTPARPNDGKLELVGLTDGWHSLLMLAKIKRAVRVAQAHGVRIELRGEHRARTYLQVDGEPWEQQLSQDSRQPTVLEISKKPRPALMLANKVEKPRVLDYASAPPAAGPPEAEADAQGHAAGSAAAQGAPAAASAAPAPAAGSAAAAPDADADAAGERVPGDVPKAGVGREVEPVPGPRSAAAFAPDSAAADAEGEMNGAYPSGMQTLDISEAVKEANAAAAARTGDQQAPRASRAAVA